MDPRCAFLCSVPEAECGDLGGPSCEGGVHDQQLDPLLCGQAVHAQRLGG
jgi:hypothetical protein